MSVERFHRGIGTGVAFELHRDTYSLAVEQSKTVTWRETSSDVSSTVPSGHWNEGGVRAPWKHVHTARRAEQNSHTARDEQSCQLNGSIGALELPNRASALTPLAVFW